MFKFYNTIRWKIKEKGNWIMNINGYNQGFRYRPTTCVPWIAHQSLRYVIQYTLYMETNIVNIAIFCQNTINISDIDNIVSNIANLWYHKLLANMDNDYEI